MHRMMGAATVWGSAAMTAGVASAGLIGVAKSLVTTALVDPADGLLLVAVTLSAAVLARIAVCCLAAALALVARRCHRSQFAYIVQSLAMGACPRLLRSTAAAALSVGLSTCGAGTAAAITPGPDHGRSRTTRPVATPARQDPPSLPSAVWPVQPATGQPATTTSATTPPAAQEPDAPTPNPDAGAWVIVQRGDCLWRLAAEHLGPGASDAAIAEEWHRWWQANRAAIGADPNRIRDGSRLHLPPPHVPTQRVPTRRFPTQRGLGGAGRSGSAA